MQARRFFSRMPYVWVASPHSEATINTTTTVTGEKMVKKRQRP